MTIHWERVVKRGTGGLRVDLNNGTQAIRRLVRRPAFIALADSTALAIGEDTLPANGSSTHDYEPHLLGFQKQSKEHFSKGGENAQKEMVLPEELLWEIETKDEVHLMYIGHDMWLIDAFTTAAMLNNESNEGEDAEVGVPLLISTNPAWIEEHGKAFKYGQTISYRAMPSSDPPSLSLLIAKFSMMGSIGDIIHRSGAGMASQVNMSFDTMQMYSVGDREFPNYLILSAYYIQNTLIKNQPFYSDEDKEDLKELFIPTFKDKRGVLKIDKSRGSPPYFHDEIRCQVCNGRVLLMFPIGNKMIEAKCPHSLNSFKKKNQHKIHFPHLIRSLDMLGDSVENTPKEMK